MARLRGIDLRLPLILKVSKIVAREKDFGGAYGTDTQADQHCIIVDRCQRIRAFAIHDPEDVAGSIKYNDWWNSPEQIQAPEDIWSVTSLVEMVRIYRQHSNLPIQDLVSYFMTFIHYRSSHRCIR